MLNFLLWLILFTALSSAALVAAAYFHSLYILDPSKRRRRLDAFPDQFGLPHENLTFRTADGVAIKGWFVPATEKSARTIICLHGYGTNRSSVMPHTYFLREHGFNLMYFDFRGCGESQGKVASIGCLEAQDLKAALAFLKLNKEQEAEQIGLYGISMGAAVAIHEAASNPEIKCLVSEATFASYEKVVGRWAWNHFKIPYYPLVPLALMFVRMKLHTDPEPLSPQYRIAHISPRPVFIIHGSHDNLVSARDARLLYRHCGEPRQLWIVPGATHGKCAETGGKQYHDKMADFFTRNMPEPSQNQAGAE
ncbi:MAG: alpha/beta hydrolase [Elusimicrobia bacterium]|nr:alpha/beta hydrolase [Elusimicrobiota bacterium]